MSFTAFAFGLICALISWWFVGAFIVWYWLEDEFKDLYELFYYEGKVSCDSGRWYVGQSFVASTSTLVTTSIGKPFSWPLILISRLFNKITSCVANTINKHKGS